MERIYERICRGELIAVKVMFVLLAALIFIAAFSRAIGHPINLAVDMAICLFAWCTFLGGHVAMRQNKLMKLDFFVSRISPDKRFYLELLNISLILIFLAALFFFGAWLTYTTRFRAFQGIPWFSYSWVSLSVPVSSLLMIITGGLQLKALLATGIPKGSSAAAVLSNQSDS